MIAPLALAAVLAAPVLPSLAEVVELIRAGQAGHAYHELVVELDDERVSRDDVRLPFVADLLRHLRCAKLGPAPRGLPELGADPRAVRRARALLDLERRRIARRLRDGRLAGPAAWLVQKRLDWSLPSSGAGSGSTITWPADAERWPDETTVVTPPAVLCERAPAPPRNDDEVVAGGPDPAPPVGGGGRSPHLENDDDVQLVNREAELAHTLAGQLAPGTPSRAPLLLDEAVLRVRLDDWTAAWEVIQLYEAELAAGVAPPGDGEAAQAVLLAALAAEHVGRDQDALDRWQRASALHLPEAERLLAAVHRQRLLIDAGRLAEARAVLDEHPGAPGEIGRYLGYRAALVRFLGGDEAGLLALARGLLGRRPAAEVAEDRILQAVEELVYLQLVRHGFDPTLVEVLESLGLVRESHIRVDRLATLALERGRPQVAADAWRWLLLHHGLAYFRPYYLGRLAAASASAGDSLGFQTAFRALVGERLAAPPPRKDRADEEPGSSARRSIEWDRQILLGSRDAITPLVARHDTAALRVLVEELRRYLRAVGDRPPYAELSQLYRLAASALPATPRGYAERVGAEHAPLFIGEVRIDRPLQVVPEPPLPSPELPGPASLLCIPDGAGGCPSWSGPEQREVAP